MYAISILIVWGFIAISKDESGFSSIISELKNHLTISGIVILCGCVFGVAMQMHLYIVQRIGLILSTSVSATCAILGGTLISIWFAGVPAGVSITLILLASVILILATICCQYAGYRRDIDIQKQETKTSRTNDIVLLAFINFVLMSAYPLANAVGLRTALNPTGLSAMACMGVLVIGALMGSLAFTIYQIQKNGTKEIRHSDVSYLIIFVFATIAAFAHFGGNILHSIFAPVISVTIATAMGNSYHVWSYVWGLLYGEFKGASCKTYVILGLGVVLFLLGVLLLSRNVV